MVFSSLFFIYAFLALFLLVYFISPNIKFKNGLIIIFSLIFYAWGGLAYLGLLILSTAINYIAGLVIDKYRDKIGAKISIFVSLVINLGMLTVFKYTGFIVENLNNIFSLNINPPDITLPIGISFYTFQAMSYTIDCYWDTVKVQKNYFKFLLYVSLFPQLVAGPIVRYSVIEDEIDNRKINIMDISQGITRITIGLAKKVILANQLYPIVEGFLATDLEATSIMGTWYAVILYALYVYFDFSGYSDMAIGIGNILGFHFNENFNHPFICKDVTEFWQRWHISLGSFFRDYLLYLPIFGKRRQLLNLFLVWFSTGIWHGASWNFIIWGLYFGTFIFIEKSIGKKKMKKIPIVLRHVYNKIIIVIGFGIFYFEDLGQLLVFFKNLIGLNGNKLIDESVKMSATNNLFIIIIAIVACFPVKNIFKTSPETSSVKLCLLNTSKIIYSVALLLISSILLVDATSNPFLYFRF